MAASRIACFTFCTIVFIIVIIVLRMQMFLYCPSSGSCYIRVNFCSSVGPQMGSYRLIYATIVVFSGSLRRRWRALVSRQLNRLITQSACTYKLATVDCGEVSLLQETLTEATSAHGGRGQSDDSSFKIQVGTTTTLIKKQRDHGSKMTLQQRPTTMPPVEFISFSLQSTIRHYEVIF